MFSIIILDSYLFPTFILQKAELSNRLGLETVDPILPITGWLG